MHATTRESARTTSESVNKSGRIAFVIGLHLIFIYLLATGLGIVKPPELLKPMQAVMVDSPQAQQPVKPIASKPQLVQQQVSIPEPEPEIEVPVETPAAPQAAPATQTSQSNAVADANLQVTRRVEPAYPPASRRGNEQGTGVFNVLVDENGHPKDVTVKSSTGFPRLDQAAIEAIRHWTFNPAVRGAQKVTAWTSVKVTFQLNTH